MKSLMRFLSGVKKTQNTFKYTNAIQEICNINSYYKETFLKKEILYSSGGFVLSKNFKLSILQLCLFIFLTMWKLDVAIKSHSITIYL